MNKIEEKAEMYAFLCGIFGLIAFASPLLAFGAGVSSDFKFFVIPFLILIIPCGILSFLCSRKYRSLSKEGWYGE